MKELIWREPKVKEATGLSKSTRWRLMKAGEFPPKIQLGPRAVGWAAELIIEWVRSREGAKNGPVIKRKSPDSKAPLSSAEGAEDPTSHQV
jgi:prophage regulatory protein